MLGSPVIRIKGALKMHQAPADLPLARPDYLGISVDPDTDPPPPGVGRTAEIAADKPMLGDTSPLLTHDDVDLLAGWQFLGEMRRPLRCSRAAPLSLH
jgi:hypothetical protein